MLTVHLISLNIFVLIAVAFFSLFERKIMGLIQIRKGPNKVGFQGVLQPFADALKLISKSEICPVYSSSFLYFMSPLMFFLCSSFVWVAFPLGWNALTFSMSCIYIMIMYSLSVYGLVFSGWFSNSKFATIGSVRALVQSISYEVGLTLSIAGMCLIISSYSISSFVYLQSELNLFFPFWPIMVILCVSLLAELNRSPFDLSEGESELVSGYSVEYGGMSYTVLFLSENIALVWSASFVGLLFYQNLMICLIFLFVWVRATLPRVRLDYMLEVFWLTVLPILLFFVSGYTVCMFN